MCLYQYLDRVTIFQDEEKSEKKRNFGYTPLSQELTDAGDHHGTFGRSRYVYVGKHSEGNRFIRNNDL